MKKIRNITVSIVVFCLVLIFTSNLILAAAPWNQCQKCIPSGGGWGGCTQVWDEDGNKLCMQFYNPSTGEPDCLAYGTPCNYSWPG